MDLLKALTVFDWISPVVAGIQDLAKGPNHTILIPEDSGWSGGDVARRLRRNGIRSWGYMAVNDHYMLTIQEADKEKAYKVLQAAGIAWR